MYEGEFIRVDVDTCSIGGSLLYNNKNFYVPKEEQIEYHETDKKGKE